MINNNNNLNQSHSLTHSLTLCIAALVSTRATMQVTGRPTVVLLCVRRAGWSGRAGGAGRGTHTVGGWVAMSAQ